MQTASIPDASTHSDLKEVSDTFIQLLQDIIKDFEQYPDSLDQLKQTIASLLLPLTLAGVAMGVAHLVQPRFYSEVKTVRELFTQLSPFMNPMSFHLLESLTRLSDCSTAAERVSAFRKLRLSKSHLVLSADQWTVPTRHDGLNDLDTTATPDAKVAHTASLNKLQSLHPEIFVGLPGYDSTASLEDTVRISARINANLISLSDYDAIVTAICGFFLLPESALVYVGCMNQPLTLCWCVGTEISGYMRQVMVKVNSEIMLAEQGIVNIMIGNWLNYKCLTVEVSVLSPTTSGSVLYIMNVDHTLCHCSLQECQLHLHAYYGALDHTPDGVDLSVPNFVSYFFNG